MSGPLCYVVKGLADEDLFGFGTLEADVEAGTGVGDLHALKVVIFHRGVLVDFNGFIGDDGVDGRGVGELGQCDGGTLEEVGIARAVSVDKHHGHGFMVGRDHAVSVDGHNVVGHAECAVGHEVLDGVDINVVGLRETIEYDAGVVVGGDAVGREVDVLWIGGVDIEVFACICHFGGVDEAELHGMSQLLGLDCGFNLYEVGAETAFYGGVAYGVPEINLAVEI